MEEKKEFKYTIGDKVYYQRKLVMGQVNQLVELTKDLTIPTDITVLTLIGTLGNKVLDAVAIVLVPADINHLKEKNLSVVIRDIEFDLTPEQTLEVVEDFFDCNQISSLLSRVGEVVVKIGEKIVPKEEQKEEIQKESSQS